jgi:peptidoglycan/LPS O-acetylase OafA/YrhL
MRSRIGDIEVLRAIAVLFVVYQHLGSLFPWSSPTLQMLNGYVGGTFGVDLFFALSGFVIARDLVPRLLAAPDRAAAWSTMQAFWIRRIWRLWPSAWLWLGLILCAVLVFNRSGAFGSFAANLEATFAGIFQYANVRFAQTFMRSEYGASFVQWSLSLEEQFYLLFPFLVVLFRRHLGWLLVVVVVVQLLLPLSLYQMMFRTSALALGILLALWSNKASWLAVASVFGGLGRLGRLSLALLCLGLMGWISSRLNQISFAISMIAALSAVLVLMASYDCDFLLPDSRCKRLLIRLGERSYAIYLIHVPAFFATRELFYRFAPASTASFTLAAAYLVCGASLLLLLTELNFRLLETPLRKHGARVAARMQSGGHGFELGPHVGASTSFSERSL